MDRFKIQSSFLLWYFSGGLGTFVHIVTDIVYFVAYYFSLGRLGRTLFSPWRRDVSFRTWRGLHPLKSARASIENIFSRLMGAFVRSIVLLCGLIVFIGTFLIAVISGLLYVGAPLLLIIGAVLLFMHASLQAFLCVVVSMSIVSASFMQYRHLRAVSDGPLTMQELHGQQWFARVYARIGVDPNRVSPAFLATMKAFTDFLTAHRLSADEFERVVAWEQYDFETRHDAHKWWRAENLFRIRPVAGQWHYGYTAHLDRYSIDLTKHDPTPYNDTQIVSHDDEMSMMELILSRPRQNNVILVGAAGIGKNALIHAFAQRVRTGAYHGTSLDDVRVVLVHLDKAIAQITQDGDDPELVLHRVFHEAAYAGNVIVVVENLDHYMTQAHSRTSFVSNILSQYLSLPTFRIVATATAARFHRLVEKESALMKQCEVVDVTELSHEETEYVLFNQLHRAEGEHQILFTYQAIRQILRDADRYNNHAPLPERAIDLATEVTLYWQKSSSAPRITSDLVDEYVSKKTGVRLGAVDDSEREKLLNLEDHLRARIHAQEEAVTECAQAIRKMRAGIGDTTKPVQSFLFFGPTGVGKTEMAKAVTDHYFGDEEKMIRLDMSEYQGEDAIARLIGSEDGAHIGTLTTAAKEQPYSVLLLDEIEKAAPHVLDLFLQILDEGIVHDGSNEKISFRNMIIIATSNAGALAIKKHVENGEDLGRIRSTIINEILDARIFRVEFLNRFDHLILFKPLSQASLQRVAELILKVAARRLSEDHNISVVFAPDVVAHVIKHGYDEIFGARSLVHYINDAIDDALAKKIIAGDIMPGSELLFRAQDLG